MRISVLQENFSKGLSIVGRAVASRTTLPITNNVLLASDGGRLKLAATNLEIAISCWIGAKVEEEGAITIPARLLTEFVNSLPNEPISFSVSQSNRSVEVKCARFQAHIAGANADDFPPIPSVSDGSALKVDPAALHKAISQVALAAATDDARPVLTGVYAAFKEDTIELAAADGFRLAVHRLPVGTSLGEKISVIIPARALNELNRLLGEQEEAVEITVNPSKGQVLFHLKNVDMVSQLLQGSFPNYSQLIPQSYACRAVVKVQEFLRATRAASIFARDGSGIVRVQVSPGREMTLGKLQINARAEEVGDNQGELDASVEGEAAKIAFNSKYLSDALSVLEDEQVSLETTSPSSPGVLRPVGSDNYTHVIMPMFVQW